MKGGFYLAVELHWEGSVPAACTAGSVLYSAMYCTALLYIAIMYCTALLYSAMYCTDLLYSAMYFTALFALDTSLH